MQSGINFILLSFVILFSAVSCSSMPKKTIDTKGNYSWNRESFEINPENQSFTAEGEVTMWIDNVRFKGKFNGDYQILSSASNKWRMMITGPFNVSVATVIINGMSAHIFHDGIWESKPWPEISGGLFNADVDGDIFSVMLGGRFKFEGVCARIDESSNLCKMNEVYYRQSGAEITEILSGDLSIIRENGSWKGVRKGKYTFIFTNKKLETGSFDESLFGLPKEEPDEFEDL